ncbi:Mbeg1-like protein [Thiolapillus sp.]
MDISASGGPAPGKGFGGSGSAASNTFPVETAVRAIEGRLDERGLFNDVTHSELREISNTLKQLSADQTNEVISRLSDASLGTWTNEIASNGWFGTGGLSTDERSTLLDDLASKLEPEQMARIYNAIGDKELRAELIETVSQRWTTDGIETAAKSRLATLPAGTGRTELQEAATRVDQLQNHALMARLSSDVYLSYAESVTASLAGNRLPQGVTRMSPGELRAELNIKQDQLIDDESGFHAAVYKIEQQGTTSYVIAFRGTEDGKDWKTNADSLYALTDQEKLAGKLVNAVLDGKRDQDSVSVTGHSLGGGLANFAGLLHNVPSIAFNAKGITNPEILAIRRAQPAVDVADQANKLITNYQVDGEALTSAQRHAPLIGGAAGTLLGGPVLGGIGAVQTGKIVHEAPGAAIETPAIRPDGKEGNMFLEAGAKVATLTSPVARVVLGTVDISGPVDRHGMDYVLRGMEHMNNESGQQLLQTLFDSYLTGNNGSPGKNKLNWIAP